MTKMFTVYTKRDCSYCEAVKRLFTMKKIKANYLELDKDFTRHEFIEQFGSTTFPQVVTEEGAKIGGATETVSFLKENGYLS